MLYSKIQLTLQNDNTWKYDQQKVPDDRIRRKVAITGFPGSIFAYVPRGTEDHWKDIMIKKALRLGKKNIRDLEKSVKNLEKFQTKSI